MAHFGMDFPHSLLLPTLPFPDLSLPNFSNITSTPLKEFYLVSSVRRIAHDFVFSCLSIRETPLWHSGCLFVGTWLTQPTNPWQ